MDKKLQEAEISKKYRQAKNLGLHSRQKLQDAKTYKTVQPTTSKPAKLSSQVRPSKRSEVYQRSNQGSKLYNASEQREGRHQDPFKTKVSKVKKFNNVKASLYSIDKKLQWIQQHTSKVKNTGYSLGSRTSSLPSKAKIAFTLNCIDDKNRAASHRTNLQNLKSGKLVANNPSVRNNSKLR